MAALILILIPNAVEPIQGGDHFANLAELLPDDVLDPLGSLLVTDYTEYKSSRKDLGKSLHIRIRFIRF